MAALFDLTGAEIYMLERWGDIVRILRPPVTEAAPFAPVTEGQVIFVRPKVSG